MLNFGKVYRFMHIQFRVSNFWFSAINRSRLLPPTKAIYLRFFSQSRLEDALVWFGLKIVAYLFIPVRNCSELYLEGTLMISNVAYLDCKVFVWSYLLIPAQFVNRPIVMGSRHPSGSRVQPKTPWRSPQAIKLTKNLLLMATRNPVFTHQLEVGIRLSRLFTKGSKKWKAGFLNPWTVVYPCLSDYLQGWNLSLTFCGPGNGPKRKRSYAIHFQIRTVGFQMGWNHQPVIYKVFITIPGGKGLQGFLKPPTVLMTNRML